MKSTAFSYAFMSQNILEKGRNRRKLYFTFWFWIYLELYFGDWVLETQFNTEYICLLLDKKAWNNSCGGIDNFEERVNS